MGPFLYLLLGFVTGFIGGLIGISGGVFLIVGLTMVFGFSQHLAQGTTLAALLPPMGLLATYVYFKAGYVDVKVALLLSLGSFLGGALGAKLAVALPTYLLQKTFGVCLLLLGMKLVFL